MSGEEKECQKLVVLSILFHDHLARVLQADGLKEAPAWIGHQGGTPVANRRKDRESLTTEAWSTEKPVIGSNRLWSADETVRDQSFGLTRCVRAVAG